MAWSTSAPSLPSGASWGNAVSKHIDRNRYDVDYTVYSARGSGNTYYLRLVVTFSRGSADYDPPYLYLFPSPVYTVTPRAAGIAFTFYYTGSAASAASVVVAVSDDSSVPISDTYVSVPVPAKLTYAVTYNGNGATGGSTSPQTHTSGTPTAILANGFTRKSYTFVEWNTRADGTGTSYRPGDSYNANAALALYAIWVKANIPVYANVGGNLKQAEKAYANIGGTVKEATVYANVGGVIKELS